MFGLVWIIMAVILAIVPQYIAPYDPLATNTAIRLQAPSLAHLFGTDEFGRDILSRVIFGTRISMEVGISVVLIDMILGLFLGAFAGYYSKITDTVIMRFADIMLAFPGLVLAILLMAAFGPGVPNIILSVSLVTWPVYARVIRGETLRLKRTVFVRASRAIGMNGRTVIMKHIIPNSIAPAVVVATLGIGYAVLAEAGISFLGLGVIPPTPSWGLMITEGLQYILFDPYIIFFPGLILSITVIAFNLFGDGLRDALDPSMRI